MADDADVAAELQAAEIESSIERHRAAQASARKVTACVDCGETLTPVRLSIKACRCVDCQEVHEIEARRYGRR